MPLHTTHPKTADVKAPQDDATLLLWRIARRADELVIETQREPGLNRICWLIAEHELAGHVSEAAMLISHEINYSR